MGHQLWRPRWSAWDCGETPRAGSSTEIDEGRYRTDGGFVTTI